MAANPPPPSASPFQPMPQPVDTQFPQQVVSAQPAPSPEQLLPGQAPVVVQVPPQPTPVEVSPFQPAPTAVPQPPQPQAIPPVAPVTDPGQMVAQPTQWPVAAPVQPVPPAMPVQSPPQPVAMEQNPFTPMHTPAEAPSAESQARLLDVLNRLDRGVNQLNSTVGALRQDLNKSPRPVTSPASRPPASRPAPPRNHVRVIAAAMAPPPPAPRQDCPIQAIVPGRVWVESHGKTEVLEVGQMLDKGKITAITPEQGVMVNGRPWDCRYAPPR